MISSEEVLESLGVKAQENYEQRLRVSRKKRPGRGRDNRVTANMGEGQKLHM